MLFEKIELEVDEEILKVVRKHWFVLFIELFGVGVTLLLPYIALALTPFLPMPPAVLELLWSEPALLLFVLALWSLLALFLAFSIWTHFSLDLWSITDLRIILVDQIHFFNRNVSIFRLERLQDIEYYIKGILPTLLNFGTIRAQTASAFESNFKTTGLPDPRGLQATIQQAMDARLKELNHNPNLSD